MPIHVGAEPLPAEDGWTCTFYPADSSAYPLKLFRELYHVIKLWKRLP